MATKTEITLVDDIDGGEATETVTFGLDGATYEIDLSDKNAGMLRDLLALFVGNARKASRAKTTSPRPAPNTSAAKRQQSKDIRKFAALHGIACPSRGRIPADVTRQYEQGYPDPKPPTAAEVETETAKAVADAVQEKEAKPKRAPRKRPAKAATAKEPADA